MLARSKQKAETPVQDTVVHGLDKLFNSTPNLNLPAVLKVRDWEAFRVVKRFVKAFGAKARWWGPGGPPYYVVVCAVDWKPDGKVVARLIQDLEDDFRPTFHL